MSLLPSTPQDAFPLSYTWVLLANAAALPGLLHLTTRSRVRLSYGSLFVWCLFMFISGRAGSGANAFALQLNATLRPLKRYPVLDLAQHVH